MYSKFHSGNCANRRSLTSLSKHWSRETEQINPFESSSGTALTSRCLFAADKRFTVSGTAIFTFLIQYFMDSKQTKSNQKKEQSVQDWMPTDWKNKAASASDENKDVIPKTIKKQQE